MSLFHDLKLKRRKTSSNVLLNAFNHLPHLPHQFPHLSHLSNLHHPLNGDINDELETAVKPLTNGLCSNIRSSSSSSTSSTSSISSFDLDADQCLDLTTKPKSFYGTNSSNEKTGGGGASSSSGSANVLSNSSSNGEKESNAKSNSASSWNPSATILGSTLMRKDHASKENSFGNLPNSNLNLTANSALAPSMLMSDLQAHGSPEKTILWNLMNGNSTNSANNLLLSSAPSLFTASSAANSQKITNSIGSINNQMLLSSSTSCSPPSSTSSHCSSNGQTHNSTGSSKSNQSSPVNSSFLQLPNSPQSSTQSSPQSTNSIPTSSLHSFGNLSTNGGLNGPPTPVGSSLLDHQLSLASSTSSYQTQQQLAHQLAQMQQHPGQCPSPNANQICFICEDKATGLHYGIITCEG